MPPATREEILSAFEEVQRDGDAYWNQFSTTDFFSPIGEAWSPAENVRHLTKSTRPVAKALSLPGIALRILFGKPKRESVSFDDLRNTYQKKLAEGLQAGRFAPSRQTSEDLQAWRSRIMSDRRSVYDALLRAIRSWPERSLDRYQLPHPAMGKLTLREMLFFTLYHQTHHADNVKRRRNELQPRALSSSGNSAE